MNPNLSDSPAGEPPPCRPRPGIGAFCRDFLVGTAVALVGFVLIWANPDGLSVAGAFLSAAGALLLLLTVLRAWRR